MSLDEINKFMCEKFDKAELTRKSMPKTCACLVNEIQSGRTPLKVTFDFAKYLVSLQNGK